MLMVCPRCGFEQPEDQFCANCGLNVAAYQSQPDPVKQRIVRHPLFYVTLTMLLAIGLISYVKSQRMGEDHAQTQFSSLPTPHESPVEPAPLPEPQPPTPSAPPSPQPETSRIGAKSIGIKETQSQAIANLQASAPETAKTDGAEAAPAPPTPTQLQMQFWEVSRTSLNALGGEVKLDQATLRAVRLPNRAPLTSLTAQGRRMGSLRSMGLRPSTSVHWDTPLGNPINNVQPGLFLDLSVVKITDHDIEIEVAGEFNSPAEESAGPGGRFVGQLGVPLQGALVLSRMVQPQDLPENSPPPSGILTILTSPDFIRQETELILLLEPKDL